METKMCPKCGEVKDVLAFYRKNKETDYLSTHCKKCLSVDRSIKRRTINGFINSIYKNQINSSLRREMVLPDYTNSQLYEWITSQPNFQELWDNYVKSGYDRWLSPSCDRLDDFLPYTFQNLRLVNWKTNASKSWEDSKSGTNNKRSKSVMCIDTGEIFNSTNDVMRKTGISQTSISKCCLGKQKTAGGYRWKYFEE